MRGVNSSSGIDKTGLKRYMKVNKGWMCGLFLYWFIVDQVIWAIAKLFSRFCNLNSFSYSEIVLNI